MSTSSLRPCTQMPPAKQNENPNNTGLQCQEDQSVSSRVTDKISNGPSEKIQESKHVADKNMHADPSFDACATSVGTCQDKPDSAEDGEEDSDAGTEEETSTEEEENQSYAEYVAERNKLLLHLFGTKGVAESIRDTVKKSANGTTYYSKGRKKLTVAVNAWWVHIFFLLGVGLLLVPFEYRAIGAVGGVIFLLVYVFLQNKANLDGIRLDFPARKFTSGEKGVRASFDELEEASFSVTAVAKGYAVTTCKGNKSCTCPVYFKKREDADRLALLLWNAVNWK